MGNDRKNCDFPLPEGGPCPAAANREIGHARGGLCAAKDTRRNAYAWPSSPSPPTARSGSKATCSGPKAGAGSRSSRSIATIPTAARTRATTPSRSISTSCGPMVLDALIKMKNEQDPTLTFRRSCREGICGSCAMNIDGRNGLACTTAIEDLQGRGPDHAAAAHGRDQGPRPRLHPFLRAICLDQAVAADRHARRPRARSGCRAPRSARSSTASTSASCAPAARPRARATGGTRDKFLGPAILLQAYRWLADSRDEMTGERLDELEDPFRLYRCHTIMNCANVCPKGLSPGQGDRRDQEDAGRARSLRR